MSDVALRNIEDADLDAVFEMMRDKDAVAMAAFTPENPDDRAAFEAHMARIRSSPDASIHAVTLAGQLVGTVAAFTLDGEREVTYWIDRAMWGCGIATSALRLLIMHEQTRPLKARAASANVGSTAVLRKNGFTETGREVSFAAAAGTHIEETIFTLG